MNTKLKIMLATGLLGVSIGASGCLLHDRGGFSRGYRGDYSGQHCRDGHGRRVECGNYRNDQPRHYDRGRGGGRGWGLWGR